MVLIIITLTEMYMQGGINKMFKIPCSSGGSGVQRNGS